MNSDTALRSSGSSAVRRSAAAVRATTAHRLSRLWRSSEDDPDWGLLNGSESTSQITALLQQSADDYTWVAAAIGCNSAAGYQLSSEEPVMAIGGFNGSDPSPTLAHFKQYVADGRIHYFIASGGGGGPSAGSRSSSAIATWVADSYPATTVDGATLYDLRSAASTDGSAA